MRLVTAARRTVALTAATALITAGGVVTGALTGIASAEDLVSVTPSSGGANVGTKHFVLTSGATQFYEAGQDSVLLRRNPVVTGQPDIAGSNLTTPDCSPPASLIPDSDCGNHLEFDADLSNIAPGTYDVIATASGVIAGDRTFTKTNAITVAAEDVPVVTDTALYTGTATPPDGQLTITGNYLAKGTTVEFVDGTGATDPALTFAPFSDGYVSKTTLRGTYTIGAGFVPGLHHLRVRNSVGQSSVGTSAFYQPKVASSTPAPLAIGQGAQALPFTFTGTATHVFNPDSTLFINAAGAGTPATDITVSGDPVVDATGKVVSAALSASPTATTGLRSITIRGADGGYTRLDNALTVTAKPHVTSIATTPHGQGYAGTVTVTGTGLTSSTVFDFGPGITASNTGSTGPTNATVALVISPTAATGARSVKATNPDGGTDTTASAFTVTAAPRIASMSPGSNKPGTSGTVTITGTGFASGATLTAAPSGVTFSAPTGNATSLSSTYTIAPDATYGPRDVTITNPDGGTTTCDDCFGVSNLVVKTTLFQNDTAVKRVTLVAAAGQPDLSPSSTVTFSLPAATDQGDLAGTNPTFDNATKELTVTAPLSNAAVGSYSVKTTTGATTLECTGCLKVIAADVPTGVTLTPSTGGQGAVSRSLTLTGTKGIYPGQTVTFSGTGITTKSTTYSAGALTVVIDIDPTAPLGARDVTVTNLGDPGTNATFAGKFTVNAAPTVTSITPAKIGQGGVVDGTVAGTLFQDGATVAVSGTGVTVAVKPDPATTATSVPVTVTVTEAAAVGLRDLTVINADGGRATKAGALEITPAPVISAFSPAQVPAGATNLPITITGSNFHTPDNDADTSVPVITPNSQLTFGDLVVNGDGTSITTTVTVAPSTTDGKKVVQITNPDGGSSRFGDIPAEAGLVVATPPAAPTVAVSAGDTKATVGWTVPVTRTDVTEYTVELAAANDTPISSQVIAAPTRLALFTGLTNGTTYHFRVKAKNTGGGYGPYSAPVSATPKYATKLTSTVTPRSSTSGQAVSYTGKLTRVTGNLPLAGKVIKLTLRPAVGAAKTVQVPTKSDGTWNYSAAPAYNTTVSTVSVADATNAAAAAPTYAESVAVRVTITAPAAGSTSGSATTLVVRGRVSPNKAGRGIGVYKLTRSGYVGIASATVRSDGTYAVNVRLPRGDYYIRTGVAAFGGNATGFSTPLLIHRR